MNASTNDLSGDALNTQRLQMLRDIAEELAGEIVFPTCLDLSMQIRACLREGQASSARLQSLLVLEPLISARLVQLANTTAHNPEKIELRDVPAACQRLGIDVVRNLALGITSNQIQHARAMTGFEELARKLWQHSRISASACAIIARHMTRIPAEEAMFAGLIHDLGAFYMLYRAAQYDELRHRPDTVKYLIMQWHESIGASLLNALELPESVVEAVADHDVPRPCPVKPRNLREVVYLGNMLAGGAFEWQHQDIRQETIDRHSPIPAYLALQEEIQAHANSLASVLIAAQPG